MKKLLIAFMCAALLAVTGTAAQAAQTYELKIQTSLATSSMYFRTLERFKKNLEALTSGQIKVELLAEGAVVKGFEVFEAVSEGIITGGMSWTHWASGKHPAGVLFSAPVGGLGLGLDQISVLSWMWDGDGLALLNEYYQQMVKVKLRAYPVLPMGPECFGWFHKKYTSFEEINKLTFRAPPGVPTEVFKAMGMPVVSMPGGEIIPAAQRGAIDAAEWIAPGEDLPMGFAEVWKHYYLQGLHQAISIGDVYINIEWYEKLPANLKAAVEVAMKACLADQMLANISVNSKALQTMVRDKGVIIEETPKEYYAKFMQATKTVLEKYMKDPFFKKVYDSELAWAKMTVPFQVRSNGLYYQIGKTAMDEGVITDYQK
ncbi:MAG: TRAP transporter substrate-binding protein [Desulfovibrio sp.]|jgi:TRAP-type mannitol/chloroaromatic compound transport system substrate-binding protein|nr:TRAP transporter substrate-binding protein [Desulfovibrio sp.]